MSKIITHRLHNQHFSDNRFTHPTEVLAWFGAIQGQDYLGAKWSLALRVGGITNAEVEQLIVDKQIVRTWLMRGTLHLACAKDVRWILGLVAPRLIAKTAFRYRQLELDENTLHRANDILINALSDGKELPRKQLYAILEEYGISTQGQRGVHMVRHASLCGLLVQSTEPYQNPTFTCLDTLPDTPTLMHDEALTELAKRYFYSRGHATLQDFIAWSGLKVSEAKVGLEAIKSDLISETLDDEQYWFKDNTTIPPIDSSIAYTPSGFDEYLLGYKDRSAVLAPEHADKVCPGRNGIFFPTIVYEGRIIGVWKRQIKKDKIIVTVYPFNDALTTDEESAFLSAIQQYGDFMELPIVFA